MNKLKLLCAVLMSSMGIIAFDTEITINPESGSVDSIHIKDAATNEDGTALKELKEAFKGKLYGRFAWWPYNGLYYHISLNMYQEMFYNKIDYIKADAQVVESYNKNCQAHVGDKHATCKLIAELSAQMQEAIKRSEARKKEIEEQKKRIELIRHGISK